MPRDLDRIDERILQELERDGQLSIVELAGRVNLTNTPCSERVKLGYIRNYKAVLNKSLLGAGQLTVVQVSLSATGQNYLNEFNSAVRGIAEIESCMLIAGSFDYLLIVRTNDISHFRDVLGDKINKLLGINQTNSFAVMEVVKEESEYVS